MIREDDSPDDDAEPSKDICADGDAEAEANFDVMAGDDLSLEQHLRLLLRVLHDAIQVHVASGDFVPSLELEQAMANAKGELNWT